MVALEKYDFGPALASLRRLAPTAPEAIGLFSIVEQAAEIKPGGKDAIWAYSFAGGEKWTRGMTLGRVALYQKEHSRLPDSGIDLVADLATANGYRQFLAMSEAERLYNYYYAVNPLTGRFYAAFDGSVWEPGGIAVSRLTQTSSGFVGIGGKEVRLSGEGVPANLQGAQLTPEAVDAAFSYQVFGAEQGQVVYSDYLTYVGAGALGHS